MPDAGALSGIRVLDLSRVLAGPSATQLLGDLGADVSKIERPGRGDDTRAWGPPFVEGHDGAELESTYYLSANRNKRGVAIDLATPEGAALVRQLAARCDVLIENFKTGTLERHGLDYASLRAIAPRLVYCSITGFGHTGPRADQAGYDFLVQAMGGIMSLTGEPEGAPMKVGVAIADVTCGMYATVAILAALRHRDRTGLGQHIDLALFDAQIASLINAGTSYFASGRAPARHGNAHPHIVPYQTFRAADGEIAIAVGNDQQFARLCALMKRAELATDPRFATNAARVRNRDALIPLLEEGFVAMPSAFWIDGLRERGVPSGPVRNLEEVFADPQIEARGMRIALEHPDAMRGEIELLGNPIKLSETPITYRRRPPALGEHTDDVLREILGMSEDDLIQLRQRGVL